MLRFPTLMMNRDDARSSSDPRRDARLSFAPTRDDRRARLARRFVLPLTTLAVAAMIMFWPRPAVPPADPGRDAEVRSLVEVLLAEARSGRPSSAPVGQTESIVADLLRTHLRNLVSAGDDSPIAIEIIPLAATGEGAGRDGATHVATIERGERRIRLRIAHGASTDQIAVVGMEIGLAGR
ncbi:MAG TPA: hypothetical protein PKC43_14300 [Phycisphaerales bacterium]|nr:hypothetical protein [Phycisphaerales bacterium]HMP38605.1 hypothetical protein [Phycisphaerales bacterium]